MDSLAIPNYSRIPAHIRRELALFEGSEQVKFLLELSLFSQLEISDLSRYIDRQSLSTLNEAEAMIRAAEEHGQLTPAKVQDLFSLRQAYVLALLKIIENTGADLAQLLREASRRLPPPSAGTSMLPDPRR